VLEFFNLNSKPGAPALGTMTMMNGKLVTTGVATELVSSWKKHRSTSAEILNQFADGWTNGYYYTKSV